MNISLNIFSITKNYFGGRWGLFSFDNYHSVEASWEKEYGKSIKLGIIGLSYSIWKKYPH